jgi:hypothetical protein
VNVPGAWYLIVSILLFTLGTVECSFVATSS